MPTRAVKSSTSSLVIDIAKENLVEYGHRYDTVQLQALELTRAGHRSRYHAHGYGGDQIKEHRQPESEQHDRQMFTLHPVHPGHEPPVYGVQRDFHQDAGQDRVGYQGNVLAQQQHHDRENAYGNDP